MKSPAKPLSFARQTHTRKNDYFRLFSKIAFGPAYVAFSTRCELSRTNYQPNSARICHTICCSFHPWARRYKDTRGQERKDNEPVIFMKAGRCVIHTSDSFWRGIGVRLRMFSSGSTLQVGMDYRTESTRPIISDLRSHHQWVCPL